MFAFTGDYSKTADDSLGMPHFPLNQLLDVLYYT